MKGKNRAAELTEMFYKTPEMRECRETAGSITNKLDPEDMVSIKIDVPRQLIRLTEFLEKGRAADAGVAPRPVTKVIELIAVNELHGELNWLVTAPGHFAHFRALWNRFCDEQGAPEERIADPSTAPAEGKDEGPF